MKEQEQQMECKAFTLQEIQKVTDYLEQNLLEDITLDDVASFFYLNSSILNQLFKMANGLTIMEYIRNRRLSESAKELKNTKIRILDLALKYGYDTPEAFTKAFMRIYGFPPSFIRRADPPLKQFLPIRIQVKIDGGWSEERKAVPFTASENGRKFITGHLAGDTTETCQNPLLSNRKKILPAFIMKPSNQTEVFIWRMKHADIRLT